MDGRVGRSRKVSFKFLHTLWVYILCICLQIYEIKIVTNILMGFKIHRFFFYPAFYEKKKKTLPGYFMNLKTYPA